MKHIRISFFLLLCIAFFSSCQEELLTPNPSEEEEPDTGTEAPIDTGVDTMTILTLVNRYRTEGCNCGSNYFPPVPVITWNNKLAKAAKVHSDDMNKNKFLEHKGTNGKKAGDRLNDVGYKWTTWGENIASGYQSEEDVIKAWRESNGHCENMMSANFKEMGIARTENYWVQVLGAR